MITSGGEAVEQVLEWFPSLNRLALKIDDREAVDLANGHLVLGAPSARDGRLTGGVADEKRKRVFESACGGEPFVDAFPFGGHPETQSVRGGNIRRFTVHRPLGGKALQNMNVIFGFAETAGLWQLPARH